MKHPHSLCLKLTVGTLLVLVSALMICCALMVNASRTVMEASAVSLTARAEQALLERVSDQLKKMGSAASASALRYVFQVLSSQTEAGSEIVLQLEDTELYNNSGISPQALFLESGKPVLIGNAEFLSGMCAIEGKYYCAVGYEYPLLGDTYLISVVRDVTEQMDQVNQLHIFCILIGLAITFASGLLIAFFLTKNLSPLRVLQQNAEAIAAGDYSGRICVVRKDEVGAVAESFNAMAEAVQNHIDQVEKTAREQNMLLHALSHEMRTPVTAISGYAYALRHMRMNREQRAEALNFMESESRRLERLYTKLTELITITDQRVSLSPVKSEELQAQILAILSPMAEKQGIRLDVDLGNATVLGDFDLLVMLITNLYDNAGKAGAKTLQITMAQGVLSVQDDGRGIPREMQDKIMQPFYQGDASRNQEGFGLGLSLCRQIALLHGSDLTVESAPGEGCTFTTLLQLHDDSKTAREV